MYPKINEKIDELCSELFKKIGLKSTSVLPPQKLRNTQNVTLSCAIIKNSSLRIKKNFQNLSSFVIDRL